jgi:hypothetical protein
MDGNGYIHVRKSGGKAYRAVVEFRPEILRICGPRYRGELSPDLRHDSCIVNLRGAITWSLAW